MALSVLDDGAERDHDFRHRRLQFERRGPRVGDVGDDELGQPREQSDCLGEVLRLGLVEVEHDGQVAALAEFIAERSRTAILPSVNRPSRSTPFANRVDDVADLLVVEQEIDELRDLDVIDGDLGVVVAV